MIVNSVDQISSIAQHSEETWVHPKTFHIDKITTYNPRHSSGGCKIYLSGEKNRRLVIDMPFAQFPNEDEEIDSFAVREDDPTMVVVGPVCWEYHSRQGFPLEEGATVEIELQRDAKFMGDLYIKWITNGRHHVMVIELAEYWNPAMKELYKGWIQGF